MKRERNFFIHNLPVDVDCNCFAGPLNRRRIMTKIDNEVVVTNIKMPFGSMVLFMVKLAVATIPAMIILSAIGSITFGLVNALLNGMHLRMQW